MKYLVILALLTSCKPTFEANAKCPANAICEAVDFGDYTITGCFSPSELNKTKSLAAARKASLARH